jgi:hypothetical protein
MLIFMFMYSVIFCQTVIKQESGVRWKKNNKKIKKMFRRRRKTAPGDFYFYLSLGGGEAEGKKRKFERGARLFLEIFVVRRNKWTRNRRRPRSQSGRRNSSLAVLGPR